jgi:hypothetical protein
MEVDRFKHRQLAPTVGRSSRSLGEFEGPLQQINLLDVVIQQLVVSLFQLFSTRTSNPK